MRRGARPELDTSKIIADYIARHSMFIIVFLVVLAAVLAFAIEEVWIWLLSEIVSCVSDNIGFAV